MRFRVTFAFVLTEYNNVLLLSIRQKKVHTFALDKNERDIWKI